MKAPGISYKVVALKLQTRNHAAKSNINGDTGNVAMRAGC